MIYIVSGIAGIIIDYIPDLLLSRKSPFVLKPLAWAAGTFLLVFSLFKLAASPETLPIDGWAVTAGWAVFGVSLSMMVVALCFNLPFRQTYVESGAESKLVKTGLYTLARHPGVAWETLIVLSLVFVSKSVLMLIAAPLFAGVNTLMVVIQDKYLFPRIFEGYDDYKKETPMFIPNRRSVKAFLDSFRKRGESLT